MKYTQALGIILGAIYGLAIRLLWGSDWFSDILSLSSITFIWVTPIIIGLIPVFISSNHLYKSDTKLFFLPVLSVFLFLLIVLVTGIEDLLCLLIIGLPSMITAGIAGIIAGKIIKERKIRSGAFSILFLPLLLSPLESMIPGKVSTYTAEKSIKIQADPEMIWKYLVEVPEIKDTEFTLGFYNYIGIPRPVKSRLEEHDGVVYRVGYFSDGLTLYETISDSSANQFITFQVLLNKSILRNKPTDQHILKSNYFRFENITYRLLPVSEKNTELILSCQYTIHSKMNGYANFWANSILGDFEARLLAALKLKIESKIRDASIIQQNSK